ncbi:MULTISPECIES: MaoC family dehydratase [Gordonia]|uniref:Putative enoyl-CoA hydratase n=1 Tax=Gordonia sihwensis NBRC 108236 TaxID=1223544 RepID=L7LLD9_9ACTN|nr:MULTISPECIES: MaoC family dehydratase [Gordonia]AUH69188.1 MaoC family dehydratase [Gordonia sp. YC-JH1]MBY4569703.1 dehydratase [Gordonia sihwensis]GAC60912.1 putative enoyl-CoA hydratase [Gordonia sihwensis NBRC 108236]
MIEINSAEDLVAAAGTHLGYSDWYEVTQEKVNLFADATGDHQWIHVDPERAAKGPFGTTIAHGYLTLSLIPVLRQSAWRAVGTTMGVNYGTDKVRFPAPVPVGSKVRAGFELVEVKASSAGQQVVEKVTIEIDGGEKPVCIAETVSVLVF